MNNITNANSTMGGGVDKPKEWQMELMMEKLRSKASQYKSFAETAKSLRMVLLEKRYPLDSVEKSQHQKFLDTLQHSIKVTSLQSMVERLESLTRQLGLKFMVGPTGVELFISSEMFYLEIVLDHTGAVRDVKVDHDGKVEQQSCTELVNCLSRGDFADFTAQLEGLSSMYQINAEKKVKSKAFSALQALEADLSTLAQLQAFMKEPFNLLHKSPVGFLEKRKGGHAMKLTYFVSPYDLLDKEKGTSEPLTVETVTSKNLGYSVTVGMEGSTNHKLQTTTIISVSRTMSGKNTPSYAPLSNQNSAVVPACFVLRLNKPMLMCVSVAKRIQQVTEMECGDLSSTHPLMSLITQHVSGGQLDCAHNKGLFVTLPDQHHCYFMTESKSMEGIIVHSIPFSHPCHVPQILGYLRQQALFNNVVSSCIRPCSKQDPTNMIMFEVSALSWQHLSISLEHPMEESMATAELDLTDIANVTCKLYTSSGPDSEPASDAASRVFQRCLSIPVTMRSVLKHWDEQLARTNHLNGNENFSLPLGAVDPGGHGPGTGNSLSDFGGLDGKLRPDHGPASSGSAHGLSGTSLAHPHTPMFLGEPMGFQPFGAADMLNHNMELAALLPSATSSIGATGGSVTPGSGSGTGAPEVKAKRAHKRKASAPPDDPWKSAKRKHSDDTEGESSSSDSTSGSTATSHDATSDLGMATPNSALGFHSDLELSEGADTAATAAAIVDKVPTTATTSDFGDSDEMSTGVGEARRSRDERKASLLLDLGADASKSLVPPSVSITPISSATQGSSAFNSVLTGMGLERRPGIEIIPIASGPVNTLPSSITITPIGGTGTTSTTSNNSSSGTSGGGGGGSSSNTGANTSSKGDERRGSDKKSSKGGRGEDRARLDKKRKRKRDEAMGPPPDKALSSSKSDPLSKPISVSIKPTEPPLCSTSPLSGKCSPSGVLKMGKGHSPKHSPAHTSSPKHGSPKSHHGSSPSGTSTGKPSMSALKSAAGSPAHKGPDQPPPPIKLKASKDVPNREKEKKLISNVFSVSNPKVKSSSVKLKQLDLSTSVDLQNAFQSGDSLPSPSGPVDLIKSSLNQVRNRKSSLSAVIDKLKSAQHGATPTIDTDTATTQPSQSSPTPSSSSSSSSTSSSSSSSSVSGSGNSGAINTTNSTTSSSKQSSTAAAAAAAARSQAQSSSVTSANNNNNNTSTSSSSSSSSSKQPSTKQSTTDTKNSEYMVKPSSDGIKITINKTRTKESKTSTPKAQPAAGSPKTHTGLKPGVNSGPASKKPQQQQLTTQKPNASSVTNLTSSASSSSSSSSAYAALKASTGATSNKLSSSSSSCGSVNATSSSITGKNSSSSALSLSSSSSSSSKSVSKVSGSPKSGAGSKESRARLNKSSAEKSLFSSAKSEARRASPTAARDDADSERAFKLLTSKLEQSYPAPLMMEGMMKSLDTNFQIPKLSARADPDKKTTPNKVSSAYSTDPTLNNIARTVDTSKMYDMMKGSDMSLPKFPLALAATTNKPFDNSLDAKTMRNSAPLMPAPLAFTASSSPKLGLAGAQPLLDSLPTSTDLGDSIEKVSATSAKLKDLATSGINNALPKEDPVPNCKLPFALTASTKPFVAPADPLKVSDSGAKFVAPAAKPPDDKKSSSGEHQIKTGGKPSSQEAAEMLLDFSSKAEPMAYPASPALSVHIVKSPAPSPLVQPSPHSASPCITDDELMDEALVGLGK